MSFAIGDVVRLKSGGPKMTVEGVADGWVNCVWFESKTKHSDNFLAETLERYEAPKAFPPSYGGDGGSWMSR